MKLNKKSILALILSLAMALSLVPAAAFAEDEENAAPRGDIEITVDEDLTEEKIEELVEEILEAEAPVSEEPEEAAEVVEEIAEEPAEEVAAEEPEELPEEEIEGPEVIEEDVAVEEEVPDEEQEVSISKEFPENSEELIEEQPAGEPVIEAATVEFDATAAYEYAMGLSAEECDAYVDTLSLEEIELIYAYVNNENIKGYKVPETVIFTEAGPFMPAVEVETGGNTITNDGMFKSFSTKKMLTAVKSPLDPQPIPGAAQNPGLCKDANGLETTKTVTANADGSYTINIEAFSTGTVKVETTTTPVDIVLVLDQSGSMAYNFNGNSPNTNSSRRQYALKQAVNSFIDSVKEKYNPKSDHRIAIVTFGSESSVFQGWTFVDSKGQTTLKNKVNEELPESPSGATNVAAGMEDAETLMGSDYSYHGNNLERQKVVIVFTDGVPTSSREFSTSIASSAISHAKNLKDAGVTVYSIGIFNGANPDQLYGEEWGYTFSSDIPCTGEVGSYWGGSWLSNLVNYNDFDLVDVPAGNRFLNYISSNFAKANDIPNEIGLDRGSYHPGHSALASGTGYKITKNYERTASGYYLIASDASALNNIFNTISSNIQTANIELGNTAYIKDIVSPYFDMPDESCVSANVVTCIGYDSTSDSYTWDNANAASVNPTVDLGNNSVTISDFNFEDNFVSKTQKTAGNYGKKLVLTFTVTPKENFWGGNNVPTNGTESGVYMTEDGQPVLVENFDRPEVNVPIKTLTIEGTPKEVYYGDTTYDSLFNTGLPKAETYRGNDVFINQGLFDTNLPALDTSDPMMAFVTPYTKDTLIAPEGADAISETEGGTVEKTVMLIPKYNGAEHDGIIVSGTPNESVSATAQATVKIKYCTLTINKSLTGEGVDYDENQSFIFHVSGGNKYPVDMDVFVIKNGSVTIGHLPIGKYTVTEDNGWAWRYELAGTKIDGTSVKTGTKSVLSSSNPSDGYIFTNSRTNPYWLNGCSYAINTWGATGGVFSPSEDDKKKGGQ